MRAVCCLISSLLTPLAAVIALSSKKGTSMPKINLGNGDLVLFETDKNIGFSDCHVVSHVKHSKPE